MTPPISLRKSTLLEGVASTSARDSQGEILDLDGADISPLLEGRGFVNSDHSPRFEHLVGRVVDAKKIKDLKDCETPTQVKFWSEKKSPFIWTKLELWDGVGHKEADSIASIYRHYQEKGEASPIKLSVEGKTIARGPKGLLKQTLIRGVALTVQPANRETHTDVVGIVKSAGGSNDLIKAEDYSVPLFIEERPIEGFQKIFELSVQARELIKGLRAHQEKARPLRCEAALGRYRALRALAA